MIVLVGIILFLQRRPEGLFAVAAAAMSGAMQTVRARPAGPALRAVRDPLVAGLVVLCLVAAAALLAAPPAPYLVNALGQLAAFAILAVSLDLVWGYLGILSLGHGLFFAIGGYVCAMHLLAHGAIRDRRRCRTSCSSWAGRPCRPIGPGLDHRAPTRSSWRLRSPASSPSYSGFASFRSRVNGVYFSIISQALVYVAMLLMFRNDTGLGGNNGMTGFPLLFGWPMGSPRRGHRAGRRRPPDAGGGARRHAAARRRRRSGGACSPAATTRSGCAPSATAPRG